MRVFLPLNALIFFFFDSQMEVPSSPMPSLAFMNAYVLQTPINLAARMLFTIGSFMVSLQGVSDSLSGLVVSARKAAKVHREFSKYSKEILEVTSTNIKSARSLLRECSLALQCQKKRELPSIHEPRCKSFGCIINMLTVHCSSAISPFRESQ